MEKAAFEDSILGALGRCTDEGFVDLLKLIMATEIGKNHNQIAEAVDLRHRMCKEAGFHSLVTEVKDSVMGQKYDQQREDSSGK